MRDQTGSPGGARTPADQIAALRAGGIHAQDDRPAWHLQAAEEAIDAQRWDVARAALVRGSSAITDTDPEWLDLSYLSLRLALSTVDLRAATELVMRLAERCDPSDAVWNMHVRDLIAGAPRVFARSLRTGLIELLPEAPLPRAMRPGWDEAEVLRPRALPFIEIPAEGLPLLPNDDAEDTDGYRAAPAAGLSSFSQDVVDAGAGTMTRGEDGLPDPVADNTPTAAAREEEVVAEDDLAPGVDGGVLDGAHFSWSTVQGGFPGKVHVPAGSVDLTDADALRDTLVTEMLANVTPEEGNLLFDTATTFLNNGDFATAELMFAAAMQVPDFRIAACEGLMQALVRAGRHEEAAANGARATRLFAREAETLVGVVYWSGVAAQEIGQADIARTCFSRVVECGADRHFVDVHQRLAALRA